MIKLLKPSLKLAKLAGIPKTAILCPMHPRITVEAELKTIVMVPYKNTMFDKKLGIDRVVGMGVSCPRCSFTQPLDTKKTAQKLQLVDESKPAGNPRVKGASQMTTPPPLISTVGESGGEAKNAGNEAKI